MLHSEQKITSKAVSKEILADILVKAISENKKFQADQQSGAADRNYDFIPFSKELKLNETIESIDNYDAVDSDFLQVALLSGDSNILSMLPEMKKHVQVVILNSLNPYVIKHAVHLLTSFSVSVSPSDFIEIYLKNNPLKGIWRKGESVFDPELDRGEWLARLKEEINTLKDKHFLSSMKRFIQCKMAIQAVSFIVTKIDFFNIDLCEEFIKLLKNNHVELSLINLSNSHVRNSRDSLSGFMKLISFFSKRCFILYSLSDKDNTKSLISYVTVDKCFYENLVKNNNIVPSEILQSDILKVLNKYDAGKGILRRLFGDSKAIKQLKSKVLEYKDNEIANSDELISIGTVIKDHMASKEAKKWALTTRVLLELDALTTNQSINRFLNYEKMALSIFSYLNRKEYVAVGEVNKKLYSLARLKSKAQNQQIFHFEYRNKKIKRALWVMQMLLGQYKSEREFKNYRTRMKIFGETGCQHIKRVFRLHSFIERYINYNSEMDNQFLSNCISTASDFHIVETGQYVWDELKIKPYLEFFASSVGESKEESAIQLQSQMDVLFMYRIGIEIEYANRNGSKNYKKALMEMANIFCKQINDSSINFYKRKCELLKKEIELHKGLFEWSHHVNYIASEHAIGEVFYLSGHGYNSHNPIVYYEFQRGFGSFYPWRYKSEVANRCFQILDFLRKEILEKNISDTAELGIEIESKRYKR